ncbi:hypothetical protein HBI25_069330 [Parastagonospora nodorum]|nr:hypothetical protein HBH99_183750 [Parastagonospora nodorum]KAH4977851.1 hypothetical protein HBI76_217950 [Parastagonospora nodorum]KAH5566296.1 hypothetical protein HBI25_069330 [Parastagonospora nodorum]KAH5645144.1 hypothetical protein HBI51_116150 [Parastagonospora nodorum]KAH5990945.1 hypothetical protein HBI84_171310 [Parastagonospora nodorum]
MRRIKSSIHTYTSTHSITLLLFSHPNPQNFISHSPILVSNSISRSPSKTHLGIYSPCKQCYTVPIQLYKKKRPRRYYGGM